MTKPAEPAAEPAETPVETAEPPVQPAAGKPEADGNQGEATAGEARDASQPNASIDPREEDNTGTSSTGRDEPEDAMQGREGKTGDGTDAGAAADPQASGLTREETRAQATNRWVLEGRRWETDRRRKDLIRQGTADGLTRAAAGDRAWEITLAEFPPPGFEPSALDPGPAPVAADPGPAEPDPGVSGLGTIPGDWPDLPPNASLAIEIQWVQASRLDVVSVQPGGVVLVDLSKADSPAPSKGALGWLDTAIHYPAKFADVTVKATAQQEDEAEHIRREKRSIAEVRAVLAEMLEG